jgi:hypothetical protein
MQQPMLAPQPDSMPCSSFVQLTAFVTRTHVPVPCAHVSPGDATGPVAAGVAASVAAGGASLSEVAGAALAPHPATAHTARNVSVFMLRS